MYTVTRLSITPVKGLGLVHPDHVALDRAGVAADRRFYVVDARGRLVTGSRPGALVRVAPAFDEAAGRLTLDFPDGSQVAGTIDLGAPLRTRFYGHRTVTGRLVEGPWSAALSDFAGVALRLARTDRPGQGADVHPATLLGDESVGELARRAGLGQPLDARRFRMLVSFSGGQAHDEDRWAGRSVRIGGATVRVVGPVPRCAITNQDPASGRRNLDVLGHIKAYRDPEAGKTIPFGVYAEVQRPGVVRVGDALQPAG